MTPEQKIAAAEAEVKRARAELIDTIQDIADQFEPKKIVREMWEGAKNKGADFAEEAVDAVKKRPVAVGGALAALTMFLARNPIKDGVSNFYEAMNKRKKATKAKPKGNAAPKSTVQEKKAPARPARTRAPRKAAPKVEKAS
jgi:hypothetical protein